MKQIIVDKYLSRQKYADIGRDLKIPRNNIYSVIERCLARGTLNRAPINGRKRKMDRKKENTNLRRQPQKKTCVRDKRKELVES